jgi:hypothetical protein
MQRKTILNKVTDYKSFVFKKVWMNHDGQANSWIGIEIEPRQNSRAVCSICHQPCPIDDTAKEPRWFEFVPPWNVAIWFAYRMQRVTCPEHGVVVEGVPWCGGKCTQTFEMRPFLANWVRRLSMTEVAECFKTSDGKVFRAMPWIVEWGIETKGLERCHGNRNGRSSISKRTSILDIGLPMKWSYSPIDRY